jgi:hypothetical protein
MNAPDTKKEKSRHEVDARPQDELRAAHQAHTLAQMLYGHLAATQGWVPPHPWTMRAPQAEMEAPMPFRPGVPGFWMH